MTKKLTYLLMSFVLLGSLSATVILYNTFKNNNNDILSNGESLKEMVTNITDIAPGKGEEVTYTLNNKGSYSLSVAFREKDKDALLNDYLVVTIKASDYTFTANLKDVLNKERMSVGDNVKEVTLTYTLPESADNSTQNQSTSFYVDLITKRK